MIKIKEAVKSFLKKRSKKAVALVTVLMVIAGCVKKVLVRIPIALILPAQN